MANNVEEATPLLKTPDEAQKLSFSFLHITSFLDCIIWLILVE